MRIPKKEQIELIKTALKRAQTSYEILKGADNPQVLRIQDRISGKIEAFIDVLELIESNSKINIAL
uniref:Uncharacterized protein n=1 Tax=viral metagenome TaxID=1070528 RepID=A0A6M3J8Z2_9ZZZZ